MPKIKPNTELFKGLLSTPEHEQIREKIRSSARKIAGFYGFKKISYPPIEEYRRMFPLIKGDFLVDRPPIIAKTRRGEEIMFDPFMILGGIRMYYDTGMFDGPHPVKLYMEGSSFFYTGQNLDGIDEFGFLVIGEEGPVAEAELFQVMWKTFEEYGVPMAAVEVKLNATGCASCRSSFRTAFNSYYRSRTARICKNCKRDFKRFPLKVLSCSDEKCRMIASHAPQVLNYLCDACKKYLRGVLEFLDEMHIPYILDHLFFKEGSIFSKFIFEFSYRIGRGAKKTEHKEVSKDGGTETVSSAATEEEKNLSLQVILGEGGRITQVTEFIGGKPVEAASGMFFLDALRHLLLREHSPLSVETVPKVFLIQLGELARRKSMQIMEMMRASGIETAEILGKDSIKTQLNAAERMGVQIAIIIGQKEALDDTIIVREVDSGIQETISQDKLVDFLKKKLINK